MSKRKAKDPAKMSEEEFINYFYTHDMSEYLVNPIKGHGNPVLKNTELISLKISKPYLELLQADADKRGIEISTLIRMLIADRYGSQLKLDKYSGPDK